MAIKCHNIIMNSLLRPEINAKTTKKTPSQSLHFANAENKNIILHNPTTIECIIGSNASGKLIIILNKAESENIEITNIFEGESSTFETKILNTSDKEVKTNIRVEDRLKGSENTSNTQVINILKDKSQCQSQSLISSGKFAQNNEAHCNIKSLLLSNNARSIATPLLAIMNNSNKAEHQAQSMRYDDIDLFYLQSRGITKEEAMNIMIQSAIEETFQDIELSPEEEKLKESLWH